MFFRYLWRDPRFFAAAVFLVAFSVCCHEFMHAFTALCFGDDTAAKRGHLTLSPFKQMGWLSLAMLFFFGIAWGQVPVNPEKFRSRTGRVMTSLAGPLTNLGLWLIFAVLACICFKIVGERRFTCDMLIYGSIMNFALFAFNLLPIPGLDGFNVLTEFFPNLLKRNSEVVKGAFFVLIALLFAFADRLLDVAKIVTVLLFRVLERVFQ